MSPCFIDHLVITAPTLEMGAGLIERALGVAPQQGGKHPRMGTHNLLLRLGDDLYLEVISPDPAVENVGRPRWFGLDEIDDDTPPGLQTWVARTEDIDATVQKCPAAVGHIEAMSRGDLNWLITIPEDGHLFLDGAAPALIQWQTASHPASHLIDYGLSLTRLQIFHPHPARVTRLLHSIQLEGCSEVFSASRTQLIAQIETPQGLKTLGG